jgi:hypothetical protein
MQDVGIAQFQFNVGQQLLSLGIVLFEIPSNMILYKVGPGKWLTLQLFLFGLVSTFQAWQHNYTSFLATRSLLGVTESGCVSGALLARREAGGGLKGRSSVACGHCRHGTRGPRRPSGS